MLLGARPAWLIDSRPWADGERESRLADALVLAVSVRLADLRVIRERPHAAGELVAEDDLVFSRVHPVHGDGPAHDCSSLGHTDEPATRH
jgi:hypothetical protein